MLLLRLVTLDVVGRIGGEDDLCSEICSLSGASFSVLETKAGDKDDVGVTEAENIPSDDAGAVVDRMMATTHGDAILWVMNSRETGCRTADVLRHAFDVDDGVLHAVEDAPADANASQSGRPHLHEPYY